MASLSSLEKCLQCSGYSTAFGNRGRKGDKEQSAMRKSLWKFMKSFKPTASDAVPAPKCLDQQALQLLETAVRSQAALLVQHDDMSQNTAQPWTPVETQNSRVAMALWRWLHRWERSYKWLVAHTQPVHTRHQKCNNNNNNNDKGRKKATKLFPQNSPGN